MNGNGMKVEVITDGVNIINGKYASYRFSIKVLNGTDQVSLQHINKRFSDFLELKNVLEKKFNCELPYELPTRQFGLWRSNGLDSEIIEDRKLKFSKFINDLLNDSFDTRWKDSLEVSEFLNLSKDWNKPNISKNIGKPKIENDLNDPIQWMKEFRDCKNQLDASRKLNIDGSSNTKLLMQLRLKANNLKNSLKMMTEEQLKKVEKERRNNLISTLKHDITEAAVGGGNIMKETNNHSGMKDLLFNEGDKLKEPKKPIVGRRKFGETNETLSLNNQEMLQLHKDKTQLQDDELLQLHQIVQRQKQMSIEMNHELIQQNELLDLFDKDVDVSSNKLHRANRRAKDFNDRS